MKKIEIVIEDIKNQLIPSNGNFGVKVEMYQNGSMLNDSRIPNPYTAQVPVGGPLKVSIDIADSAYNLPGINFKVFDTNNAECCYGAGTFDLMSSSTPPVNTNRTYQLLMSTTGYGFDPDSEHGLSPEWVSRIEAFKYSWGYGITGISVCIKWQPFEPSQGVYRLDGIQKNIDFCNERGLTLSYKFWGLRDISSPMILDAERMKGALGKQFIYGFDVHASHGCDRTNALISNAAAAIANKLKTYSRAGHMMLAGGHTEELLNPAIDNGNNPESQMTDFCEDNLNRFNAWVSARGITSPGFPPVVNGVPWPHPNFNDPLGLEFGRFQTFNLYKYNKNFVDAVKSVSNIPCLYFYAATSSAQLQCTSNPNFNWIAGPCDGMYGSDGDGGDLTGKFRSNAVNLGTFPTRISAVEFDADDLSHKRETTGQVPDYCENQLDYAMFKNILTQLFDKGLDIGHLVMAYCETEIAGFESVLHDLHQTHIGKPRVQPTIDSSNTVVVNVTDLYRQGQDLLSGINVYEKYVRYTDDNFWGGVSPFIGSGPPDPVQTIPKFEPWSVGGKFGEVWLPANYSSAKKYAVIYANDGQTLYAKDAHPNGNWNFDVRTQDLINAGAIKDCIVVSIVSGDRMRDFLPNKPFYTMPAGDQATIANNNGGGPLADEQLNWLVGTLKPYIDSHYSTSSDKNDTVILGASMGGLFAAYAYGERPDVFGRAACVSTHYQATLINVNDELFTDDMVNYINNAFQGPGSGAKVYFDHGTESLDANYGAPQAQVDTIMQAKGFNSSNWETIIAQGAGHDPNFWGERLAGILTFLIPNTANNSITTFLNDRLSAYQNNIVFGIEKQSVGPVYQYTRGSYNQDSVLPVMSLSKAVTAATLLTLVDDGLLSPDTRIGDVLPDWTGSKGAVKLKEIMNHTSGLPDNQNNEGADVLSDWVNWYRDQPGMDAITTGNFAYRTVPWQVAARMAEVKTGKPWKQLWKERIGDKCQMGSAEYNPYQPGPPSQNPDNPHAGYGLFCSYNQYMNFLKMIRDGGVFNGTQVISAANLALLWTPQTSSTEWGWGMIRGENGIEIIADSQKGCRGWVNRDKKIASLLITQAEYNDVYGYNVELTSLVRQTIN